MIGSGTVLTSWALIELNKSLLAAFARADKGGLAGIMHRNHHPPDELNKRRHV
jgi:hypothetical protein